MSDSRVFEINYSPHRGERDDLCGLCNRNITFVRKIYTKGKSRAEANIREIAEGCRRVICIECFIFMKHYFQVPCEVVFDVAGYIEFLAGRQKWQAQPSIVEIASR